jgi:N-dimethylarginine dimethylaminohydrolase
MGPPRILMCPPDHYGIEYEINPWMSLRVGSEPEAAGRQWRGLHETLVGLGAAVALVEPVAGLPDMVFTANAGLVHREVVVLSRFRHGVRQGEEAHFASWFRAHGFTVVELPAGRYVEGAGDALFCGETLFAGYRFRSDAAGHQWIGAWLGVEVLPMELVDPRYYHLDTCFCPLAAGAAIVYPGAFDAYGRDVLRAHIPDLIEVSDREAATFGCNAVVVGRAVVLGEGAPNLARALAERGYEAIPLPLSEFLKAGGGAKCLTLRLDGEEAAAWRAGVSAGPEPGRSGHSADAGT